MAPLTEPQVGDNRSTPHVEDFGLAERCLEGEYDSIRVLQTEYGPKVVAFLMRSGADLSEAEEVVDQLWADLLAASPDERPKLARYDGSCRLGTWLNTVAMNRLLTIRRSQKRRENHISTSLDTPSGDKEDDQTLGSLISAPEAESADAPLISLLRGAIQTAFAECPAETFVLLQLAHSDGLLLRELGQIWGCNPSTISRRLEQAAAEIAQSVQAYIRAADPMLHLTWSDFTQICRTTSLGALGFD